MELGNRSVAVVLGAMIVSVVFVPVASASVHESTAVQCAGKPSPVGGEVGEFLDFVLGTLVEGTCFLIAQLGDQVEILENTVNGFCEAQIGQPCI